MKKRVILSSAAFAAVLLCGAASFAGKPEKVYAEHLARRVFDEVEPRLQQLQPGTELKESGIEWTYWAVKKAGRTKDVIATADGWIGFLSGGVPGAAGLGLEAGKGRELAGGERPQLAGEALGGQALGRGQIARVGAGLPGERRGMGADQLHRLHARAQVRIRAGQFLDRRLGRGQAQLAPLLGIVLRLAQAVRQVEREPHPQELFAPRRHRRLKIHDACPSLPVRIGYITYLMAIVKSKRKSRRRA